MHTLRLRHPTRSGANTTGRHPSYSRRCPRQLLFAQVPVVGDIVVSASINVSAAPLTTDQLIRASLLAQLAALPPDLTTPPPHRVALLQLDWTLGHARATNDSHTVKMKAQDALILQIKQTIADHLQQKVDANAAAALATATAQALAGPDAARILATIPLTGAAQTIVAQAFATQAATAAQVPPPAYTSHAHDAQAPQLVALVQHGPAPPTTPSLFPTAAGLTTAQAADAQAAPAEAVATQALAVQAAMPPAATTEATTAHVAPQVATDHTTAPLTVAAAAVLRAQVCIALDTAPPCALPTIPRLRPATVEPANSLLKARLLTSQWTQTPGGLSPPWSTQDTINLLWSRGGPETSDDAPTRCIEIRTGGTPDDHKWINVHLILSILLTYATAAGTEIAMITSPFRMNDDKLLGPRMPNLRFYFPTPKGRDDVMNLWSADLDAGLTIQDLEPVPVLLDGSDYRVHMLGNVLTTTQLSDQAFEFIKPDVNAAYFRANSNNNNSNNRSQGGTGAFATLIVIVTRSLSSARPPTLAPTTTITGMYPTPHTLLPLHTPCLTLTPLPTRLSFSLLLSQSLLPTLRLSTPPTANTQHPTP